MAWIVDIGFILFGLGLIFWANPLSLRYNAWTTRFRERNPHFNPPPTPEWRARNTKIMAIMFRILGAAFVLRFLLGLIASRTH